MRRRKHKLVIFYQMYNDIAPSYLSSLVPRPDQNASRYSLRSAINIRTIHSLSNQYCNYFLPAVIRDWNDLPYSDRIVDTVDDFKRQLSQGRVIVQNTFMQATEACRYFILDFELVAAISITIFTRKTS